MRTILAFLYSVALLTCVALPEAQAQFKWSNPIVDCKGLPDSVQHATFRSPSMDVDVGYCIYFPPGYDESDKRYSVIYILHGGATAAMNGDSLECLCPSRVGERGAGPQSRCL